jgi:hypothetical protein
MKQGGRKRTY